MESKFPSWILRFHMEVRQRGCQGIRVCGLTVVSSKCYSTIVFMVVDTLTSFCFCILKNSTRKNEYSTLFSL